MKKLVKIKKDTQDQLTWIEHVYHLEKKRQTQCQLKVWEIAILKVMNHLVQTSQLKPKTNFYKTETKNIFKALLC